MCFALGLPHGSRSESRWLCIHLGTRPILVRTWNNSSVFVANTCNRYKNRQVVGPNEKCIGLDMNRNWVSISITTWLLLLTASPYFRGINGSQRQNSPCTAMLRRKRRHQRFRRTPVHIGIPVIGLSNLQK